MKGAGKEDGNTKWELWGFTGAAGSECLWYRRREPGKGAPGGRWGIQFSPLQFPEAVVVPEVLS